MKNGTSSASERVFAKALLSLSFSVLLSAGGLWLASRVLHFEPDAVDLPRIFAVPVEKFAPEPLERALYALCAVLVPAMLFATYAYLSGRGAHLVRRLFPTTARVRALVLGTGAAALALAWAGLARDDYDLAVHSVGTHPAGVLAAAAALALLLWASLAPSPPRATVLRGVDRALCGASVALIASSALLCVFDGHAVTEDVAFTSHFNSVFHSVVQVALGAELLVDTFNLYGLWPHIIEPVFRVVPLSVGSFTVLMGVLTGASFLLLFLFLRSAVSNRPLAALGFVATAGFGYVLGKALNGDPYFQYHPVRFLFPAASVYMAYRYFATGSRAIYYASFVLFSVAVLWNFETGAVVLLSWTATLLFTEIGREGGARRMLAHLLTGSVAGAAVFLAFNGMMFLRYGRVPDYGSFLAYHALFYKYGFMMIPMKPLHPWNIVAFLYAAGILYGIAGTVERRSSPGPAMAFFLAVLGTGLFAYFQGRSNNGNLLAVSYPAVLLATLFADAMLDRIRGGLLPSGRAAFAGLACFLVIGAVAAARGAPAFARTVASRLAATAERRPTPVTRGAEFIRGNTKEGDEVFILSGHSGIYYLACRRRCRPAVPGTADLALVEDFRKIHAYLDGRGPDKLFVDQNFDFPYDDLIFPLLGTRYRLVAVSPDNTLGLFVRGGPG